MLPGRTQFADSVRRLFSLRCRFPHIVLLASFVLAAGVAGRARAEEEILKLVPEQALGFVFVNRPDRADDKLQKLGEQMKLPIPSLLARLQGPDGIPEGLDKTRPMAMLVLPPKDDKSLPPMIALLPVSSYATFLKQFKSAETKEGVTEIQIWSVPMVVRKVGNYAALTVLLFREALEKDVKLADEVPAALVPWRSWLATKDAATVVLSPGIRLLSAKVRQGVAAVKPILAATGKQAKQAAAALDMYVMLFQAAEKEVASGGLGVERDEQGAIRLSKRACLVHGGAWARFVAEGKPAEQNVLAGLPAGPFVVAGGGPLTETTLRTMMDFSFGMIKNMHDMYGLSEEQAETFSELHKMKFPAVRGLSMVFGVGQSGEPIFTRLLGVMRIDNRETFLADYDKFLARYNQIVEKIKSPVFQPAQVEKTEFDGIPALKVTMSVPQIPNMPESAKMMELMYGPGGKITAWLVPCTEHTVVFSYFGKEPLREVIAAIKQGKPDLAADVEVAKVSAMLPAGATWTAYCSPKGILDFIKLTLAAGPASGAAAKIPEFGPTPPIALAVTSGADEVEVHLIVPAEVLTEIARLAGTTK